MDEFTTLMAALNNTDPDKQKVAAERLENYEITAEQGLALIAAAAKTYPNDEERKYETLGAKLLRPCWNDPEDDYVPAVFEHYAEFCRDENKQWQALRILTELATEESLTALVSLLSRPESKSAALELPLVPLIGSFWGNKEPDSEMAVLFPGWFALLDHLDDLYHVYQVISNCQAGGVIDFADYPNFMSECVSRAEQALQTIDSGESNSDDGSHSAEVKRAGVHLEWILDLIGEMKHPGIEALLRKCLDSKADQVKLFAVVSALKHRIPVTDDQLASLAKTPANRHRLWRLLRHSDHLNRFPKNYATIPMLAEANMVHWLEFPTEMGRAPEHIEPLVKVQLAGTDNQPHEAHFFKFRHPEFLDGQWFVGYAGTYASKGPPTLHGDGAFSRFAALDSKTIEEHVAMYLNDTESDA